MKKEVQHQLDTYQRKNADYKNSFHKTVCKYGLVAGIVRISDKLERIENLLNGSCRQVDDETLLDSIGDMATYCIMMAAECAIVAVYAPEAYEEIDNSAMVHSSFYNISKDIDASDSPVSNALKDAKIYFYWLENLALGKLPLNQYTYANAYQYAMMLANHMLRWYVYGEEK